MALRTPKQKRWYFAMLPTIKQRLGVSNANERTIKGRPYFYTSIRVKGEKTPKSVHLGSRRSILKLLNS